MKPLWLHFGEYVVNTSCRYKLGPDWPVVRRNLLTQFSLPGSLKYEIINPLRSILKIDLERNGE